MRLAVVSDIHGNLPALQAVVADAGRVDGWLNLRDPLAGPLWPAEAADFLVQQAWPTIAGNHERQMLAPDPLRTGRVGRRERDLGPSNFTSRAAGRAASRPVQGGRPPPQPQPPASGRRRPLPLPGPSWPLPALAFAEGA